ncbi:hypothetical protein IJC60_02565 [bacterium]|nr:hypothetical protein [bacterium]
MQKTLSAIIPILFWVYVIATFLPIYSLISEAIEIPIINLLISFFIADIPIVNCIVGIIGATKHWGVPVLGAILFYFAPLMLFLVMLLAQSLKERK